jgi:hypothetical protein
VRCVKLHRTYLENLCTVDCRTLFRFCLKMLYYGWLLGNIFPQECLWWHIYCCFSLVEVKLHSFLVSVDGGEWLVSGCGCFISWRKSFYFIQRAQYAWELFWTWWRKEFPVLPTWSLTLNVQNVVIQFAAWTCFRPLLWKLAIIT